MNRHRPFLTKLTLATAGLALIWSAARAGDPNVGESLRDSQIPSRSNSGALQLPAIPTPRTTSMSLPMPRLERMANAPLQSSREAAAKIAMLASGEQIAAILRGPVPTAATTEPQTPRDTERAAGELASRRTKSNVN
jgi:hypothetical protein